MRCRKRFVLPLVAAVAFAMHSPAQVAAPDGKVGPVANQVKAVSKLSPEEMARRREEMLRRTGGLIERKSEGKLLFVNCQSRIPDGEIKQRVERISFVLKYAAEIRRGTWKFGDAKPSDATVVVWIVDDEKLPMSLVAPEAAWGVVNTAGLKLGRRFTKELTRVFCLTAGNACSMVKTSPMQPVRTPKDLDALITDGFTFDMAASITSNLKSMGVTPTRKTSYIRACQEGWAPPPTNDVQRAIWEKVRSEKERGPANPIEIPLPKKK